MTAESMLNKPVWVYDDNRRIYSDNSYSGGKIIWREHWHEQRIVSETTKSWVTNCKVKIPKGHRHSNRTKWSRHMFGVGVHYTFDYQDVLAAEWVVDNVHDISRTVNDIRDPELLREVAKLIGYKQGA